MDVSLKYTKIKVLNSCSNHLNGRNFFMDSKKMLAKNINALSCCFIKIRLVHSKYYRNVNWDKIHKLGIIVFYLIIGKYVNLHFITKRTSGKCSVSKLRTFSLF